MFSGLKGKKREHAGLVHFFSTLMEDNFPGVFDVEAVEAPTPVPAAFGSSRKRGRHEVEDSNESLPEVKKVSSRTKQAEVDIESSVSIEAKLTYNEKVSWSVS